MNHELSACNDYRSWFVAGWERTDGYPEGAPFQLHRFARAPHLFAGRMVAIVLRTRFSKLTACLLQRPARKGQGGMLSVVNGVCLDLTRLWVLRDGPLMIA